MELHSEIASLSRTLRTASGATVGFVPTMGALHEGHLSLLRRARSECDLVVLSIFVNPLQFGPADDYDRYPKTLDRDVELAAAENTDVVFSPSVAEMYPDGRPQMTVRTSGTWVERLEGELRPGHFDGVATVVAKLFGIVEPSRAYFGEKDWQQLAVVRRMVADLSMPIEIVACPIVRDADDLALSSRNSYLSDEERQAARMLSSALFSAAALVEAGERRRAELQSHMFSMMSKDPLVRPAYADIVDETFSSPDKLVAGKFRLLVSAQVGSPRLLDNVGVELDEEEAVQSK